MNMSLPYSLVRKKTPFVCVGRQMRHPQISKHGARITVGTYILSCFCELVLLFMLYDIFTEDCPQQALVGNKKATSSVMKGFNHFP